MNWPEFFNAFAGAAAVIIAALAAAWTKVQNGKLTDIKSEATAAKKSAEDTAATVKESREERTQQIEQLANAAGAAFDHANNTNDKLARQNQEILELRREIAEIRGSLPPPVIRTVGPGGR